MQSAMIVGMTDNLYLKRPNQPIRVCLTGRKHFLLCGILTLADSAKPGAAPQTPLSLINYLTHSVILSENIFLL